MRVVLMGSLKEWSMERWLAGKWEMSLVDMKGKQSESVRA